MTMDYELDETERKSRDGTLAREGGAGEARLETVGYAPEIREPEEEVLALNDFLDAAQARLRALEEERDTLAEREAEIAKVLGAVIGAATLRPGEGMVDPPEHAAVRAILSVVAERDTLRLSLQEGAEVVAELEGRLEECRPVVRAAKAAAHRNPSIYRGAHDRLVDALDALTSTTRAWAEGDGEEET